ncbi:hypothetical protein DIPPA_12320 [Diplonema papillatum]|nr:hypothetical protein DIPPA_12320 [Diplonema papillatum]
MKKTAHCKPILRPYLLQATASMGALAPRFNINLEHVARDRNTDADNAAMGQVQAQTSGEVSTIMAQYEAYRRSALAKARTLHTLANTAARIYGTAWHPGRVANVTSATALGGGVMQGVSCRAVLSPQTEAVLRSMSRGASDTEGTTPNPFVKAHERWAASIQPERYYEATWKETAEWKGRGREDPPSQRSHPPTRRNVNAAMY